ncbi:MAG TPA: glycosyltransferase [Planctomycetota bacterium]|nr:glycosyltransferase [Planctomycetota bacterium]
MSSSLPPCPKIALVGTLPPWKGISPYCEALARALATADPATPLTFLDFDQLYPAGLYPGASMTAATPAIPPAALPVNLIHRRELHYARPDEAFKLGRSLDADVLHVQFWSEFLAPTLSMLIDGFHAAATAGHPRRVVMTLHNLAPHEDPAALPFLKRIAQSWKDPFGLEAVRRADAWIVHYAAGRAELAARLPVGAHDRIHVIPHGLLEPAPAVTPAQPAAANSSFINPSSISSVPSRAAARTRLRPLLPRPLPADAPLFLLFGNLRPYKGVDVALRALALCAADPSAQAHLLVAGSPWKDFDLAAMQSLADDLDVADRVDWITTFIPDTAVADLLAAADALVLPYTRFDAMSGVASLGLRAGLPAIVSRVGGLPEMIPPDARDRLVIPPSDPAALAQAITALLADPALASAAARPPAEFLARFQWPAIADQTRQLYRSVVPELK